MKMLSSGQTRRFFCAYGLKPLRFLKPQRFGFHYINHSSDNIPDRAEPKPNITHCRFGRAVLTLDNYQLTINFSPALRAAVGWRIVFRRSLTCGLG
jgi:hypothetical protein